MRGKLINNELVYAPNEITVGTVTYIPAPDEILAEQGWKNIIETEYPTEQYKNKHFESALRETETEIIREWHLVDDTAEQICSRLRSWFDDSYGKFAEMLTRYEALKITKTIDDEYRGKSYSSLIDLYREAEVVRDEIHQLENGDLK